MTPAAELSQVIYEAACSTKPAALNQRLRAWCAENGLSTAVTFASCRGGTQNIYNRLNQSAVQRATDLAILILDKNDSVQNVVEYVVATLRGQKDSRPPSGPIAFARLDAVSQRWHVAAVVARRATKVSAFVAAAHEAEVTIVDGAEVREPATIESLTLADIERILAEESLFFDVSILIAIVAALRSGKHVMLTGAPGTGKTSLGLAVARAAYQARISAEPLLTTGTADWSSVETVGAYRLTRENRLKFEPGHVLRSIADDRWLVVDELNRSDIDKAIGQLFTVLSGHAVTLPFTSSDDSEQDGSSYVSIVPSGAAAPGGTVPIEVTSNWRMIATMNDRDQDLLFSLSDALMRRFAVVRVHPPRDADWARLLALHGETGAPRWNALLRASVRELASAGRSLGAAVILDAASHLRQTVKVVGEAHPLVGSDELFESAWASYIAPQIRTDVFGVSSDSSSSSILKRVLVGNEDGSVAESLD